MTFKKLFEALSPKALFETSLNGLWRFFHVKTHDNKSNSPVSIEKTFTRAETETEHYS